MCKNKLLVLPLLVAATFACNKKSPTEPSEDFSEDVAVSDGFFVSVDVLVFSGNAYPRYKFTRTGPEVSCDEAHWHSNNRPVAPIGFIDEAGFHSYGYDSILDAFEAGNMKSDAPACGHGRVSEVQGMAVLVFSIVFDDYVEDFGGS